MVQSMQRPPPGAHSLNLFYCSTFYCVQSHTAQMQEKRLHSDGNIFQDVHLIINQITDMQQHMMDMTQQYFTFLDTLIGLVAEPQPAERKSECSTSISLIIGAFFKMISSSVFCSHSSQ